MTQSTIHVGNAPCSWGTLEFEGLEGERVGYSQMLDELVETGYTGTELGDWGFMPTDPEAVYHEMAQRDLNMLGAFVGVTLKEASLHAEGEATALRTARLLAGVAAQNNQTQQPFLVLADNNASEPVRVQNAGRATPEMGLSETEWQTFARGAERIARAVREETGLRTVFHHHSAGYVETPAEIARFLELTDPDLLGLVFDTGHYAFGAGEGGCDEVLAALDRFSDRIWYVHFKDCEPDIAARSRAEQWDYFKALQHGVFCELGQGCIDFPGVLAWMHRRGDLNWALVEQDVLPGMGAPRESAQRNRAYLKKIGL